MALCPEHPKRDQNPKFTPLSETTSIPVCFIWESTPRGQALKRRTSHVKKFILASENNRFRSFVWGSSHEKFDV